MIDVYPRDRRSSINLNHPLKTEQTVTAVALAALLIFGFYMTDMHMAAQAAMGRSFWHPALSWDLRIPFEPSWIWIYLLYFPMCFVPLLFKEVREDIGAFRRTAAGFALQFIVALVFFWALPSQMIRPGVQTGGISERVLASFYEIDPGFNIFPSLHVANAAYIACMTNRFEGKLLGASMWLLCGLIALSTLFVKQHYLSDLLAGLGVGVAGYRLAFSMRFDFLDPCGAKAERPCISGP